MTLHLLCYCYHYTTKSGTYYHIDYIKLIKVDIINSTVPSIDSIGSITFEMVKQEVQRDQKMWRPVDTITNLVDYDNLPD